MNIVEQSIKIDDLLNGICVYCGNQAQGNHAIHRDGFGEGPEAPLCDDCGAYLYPTCEQIWEKISEHR